MRNIGIDLGTTFVKCVTDNGKYFSFPTLHCYFTPSEWDETEEKLLNFVGYEATKYLKKHGVVISSPITSGEPKKTEADSLKRLILHALEEANPHKDDVAVVLGLPSNGVRAKSILRSIVKDIPQIKKHGIILQASGAFISMNTPSVHVVSLGGDTTEFIIYDNYVRLFDESGEMSFKHITDRKGKYAYLNIDDINEDKSPETLTLTRQFAKWIDSNIRSQQKRRNVHMPIALTGGGIMNMTLRKHLLDMLQPDFEVVIPDNPNYANAIGMQMAAAKIPDRMEQ